ncbi:MAG: hypothetical protein AMXMBFR64_44380 [Myxococcales bacterium]
MAKPKNIYGLLAQFETPRDIFHACENVRDAGFKQWDAHTPFPVHGLDGAMGMRRSKLPFIVLVAGLTGATLAFALQWWVSVEAQPIVIAGKPLFSWPAFVPVTFELAVLFGALGAVLGMLGLNKLPQFYHSLFRSERFERVTDDKFFISIEAADPKFDLDGTTRFLQGLGATHVEVVES